jgi:urate oxidase
VKLRAQRYGKSRVRVLKVLRTGTTHTVKELSVDVALEGDFETSFTRADNSRVVPTDTMKNLVNALAHEHLGGESEPFARQVAGCLLDRYPQVSRVTLSLDERAWARLEVDGTPHPHSFVQRDRARWCVRLVSRREPSDSTASEPAPAAGAGHEHRLESGIRDLLIMKSTGSGFEGFPRCEHTTLPETTDRILASALTATWRWHATPSSYAAANERIVRAMLGPFASRYSPSVQATLFEMGSAALEACPEIEAITIAMPNLHCLRIDLSAFGRENANELFVPTDEPHGQIEATISR